MATSKLFQSKGKQVQKNRKQVNLAISQKPDQIAGENNSPTPLAVQTGRSEVSLGKDQIKKLTDEQIMLKIQENKKRMHEYLKSQESLNTTPKQNAFAKNEVQVKSGDIS